MKPYLLIGLGLLLLSSTGQAQVNLHTEDLPRFYQAFDSVMTTTDTARQLAYIQKLYVEQATQGLKEFMALRGGNAPAWRKFILANKASLLERRPYILSVLSQEAQIKDRLARYRAYYPNFRQGDIYFCMGINNSGGTIRDKTVYIGAEVAAAATTNWAVALVLHEFTHTQQYEQRHFNRLVNDKAFLKAYEATHQNLLGKCISEGMADFVAELILGQPLTKLSPSGYLAFGARHEDRIWSVFTKEMNQAFDWNKGWLYNERTIQGKAVRDLGYFVGYQICRRYYLKATDKKRALAFMIELNLTDQNARQFLATSGYSGKGLK